MKGEEIEKIQKILDETTCFIKTVFPGAIISNQYIITTSDDNLVFEYTHNWGEKKVKEKIVVSVKGELREYHVTLQ